jgi:toxin ParE1/3/4
MTAELVWSTQARADLLEIYVMIGLEQPAAAERYFDRIEDKARLLKSQPRMGVRRPDIRPSMRMLRSAVFDIVPNRSRYGRRPGRHGRNYTHRR